MKIKSFALGAVMAVALFVAGESVIILDHASRAAAASSHRVLVHFAKSNATQFAQHVVRALVSVTKS